MTALTPEQRAVVLAAGEVYRSFDPTTGLDRAQLRESAPRLVDALEALQAAVHEFAGSELVRDIRPEDFEDGVDQ